MAGCAVGQWHLPLVGENFGDSTRLVNIDTFGTDRENK